MALLGIDLGGTKLALALFSDEGRILLKETAALENRKGSEVGKLITDKVVCMIASGNKSGNKISFCRDFRSGYKPCLDRNCLGSEYPGMGRLSASEGSAICMRHYSRYNRQRQGLLYPWVNHGREMPGAAGMQYFYLWEQVLVPEYLLMVKFCAAAMILQGA